MLRCVDKGNHTHGEPVNVTNWEEQQDFGTAVPDNNGGAYIAWIDAFSDEYAYDIWAQHLGNDGNLLRSEHGIQVVGEVGVQGLPMMTSDNQNGFVVAWRDFRFDPDVPYLGMVQKPGQLALHFYVNVLFFMERLQRI